MVKGIRDLQNSLHSRFLLSVTLSRLAESAAFVQAFEAASELEKAKVFEMADNQDKEGLLKWAKDQLRKSGLLELLSVRDLRVFAQELGVVYYCYMSKVQLMSAIYQTLRLPGGQNESTTTDSECPCRDAGLSVTSGHTESPI